MSTLIGQGAIDCLLSLLISLEMERCGFNPIFRQTKAVSAKLTIALMGYHAFNRSEVTPKKLVKAAQEDEFIVDENLAKKVLNNILEIQSSFLADIYNHFIKCHSENDKNADPKALAKTSTLNFIYFFIVCFYYYPLKGNPQVASKKRSALCEFSKNNSQELLALLSRLEDLNPRNSQTKKLTNVMN